MSPVAGTELIEESDIPIVELVDPHALKAKAEIRETAIKVFLNNLSPSIRLLFTLYLFVKYLSQS
jgi:glutamate racemase